MSDEDRDVDVESDEDDEANNAATQYMTQAEKRAHHNALERKRRDHIKDSFHGLRDSVPSLCGEKTSRAQILKSATEYIQYMTKKNSSVHADIGDLKKQNQTLEQQIRALERARAAGSFAPQPINITVDESPNTPNSDSESSETEYAGSRPHKKLKTELDSV